MLDQIKEILDNLLDKINKAVDNAKSSPKKKDKAGNKAKERLHIVLVQDRANISTDFLELMKQEIIDVIKKYVVVDESKLDVRFTNSINSDGSHAAPTLYANVPILNIRNEMKSQKLSEKDVKKQQELEGKVSEALKKDDQFETMKVVLEAKDINDKEKVENKDKKEEKIDLNAALKDAANNQREKNKKENKSKNKNINKSKK